jgi:hypothetical protein
MEVAHVTAGIPHSVSVSVFLIINQKMTSGFRSRRPAVYTIEIVAYTIDARKPAVNIAMVPA